MITVEDLPALEAPDLIHPVIGFRQWRLTDDGLCSLMCDEPWTEASLVARCREGSHPGEAPPVAACTCGIYAWYAPSPRTASVGTSEYVTGAVVLWGALELHAIGMRAARCRIVALALPFSRWGKRDRVVAVARALDVPTVPHRALWRVAREHGATIPRELRPPRVRSPIAQAPIGAIPWLVARATTAGRRA